MDQYAKWTAKASDVAAVKAAKAADIATLDSGPNESDSKSKMAEAKKLLEETKRDNKAMVDAAAAAVAKAKAKVKMLANELQAARAAQMASNARAATRHAEAVCRAKELTDGTGQIRAATIEKHAAAMRAVLAKYTGMLLSMHSSWFVSVVMTSCSSMTSSSPCPLLTTLACSYTGVRKPTHRQINMLLDVGYITMADLEEAEGRAGMEGEGEEEAEGRAGMDGEEEEEEAAEAEEDEKDESDTETVSDGEEEDEDEDEEAGMGGRGMGKGLMLSSPPSPPPPAS